MNPCGGRKETVDETKLWKEMRWPNMGRRQKKKGEKGFSHIDMYAHVLQTAWFKRPRLGITKAAAVRLWEQRNRVLKV